jgi:hypothetical protein
MLVRFWGTRGSLPVAQRADAIQAKISHALVAAGGRRFADEAEADAFARANLDFAAYGAYGGATSCVEIEGADGAFLVCASSASTRSGGSPAATRRSITSSCPTFTGTTSWASRSSGQPSTPPRPS